MRAQHIRFAGLAALAAMMALTAGLFASSAAAEGDATLEIGSLDPPVGSQETVELWARDVPEPGLGAWTVDVAYDPEVLNLKDCEAEHGAICNTEYEENALRVSGVSALGIEGDVLLASITFSCKKAGESPLTLSPSVFADATPGGPQPMDAKIDDGAAVCSSEPEEPTPKPEPTEEDKQDGDVNCDGDVNSVDAALLLQLLAQLLGDVPCEEHGDLNGDGGVTAVDAALLLQQDAGLI